MRRVLAATFVLAIALALAAPAVAATPSPKKMAAQIAALQKQVKKLNTTVRQTETVAVVALLYGGCSTAATADALQGGNAAVYGSAPVADYNSCSDARGATLTTYNSTLLQIDVDSASSDESGEYELFLSF